MSTKGNSLDRVCGLLSGLRVEGGQMINGSEGVPWVDGDTLKPDSGGISLGSQSTAAVWGKGH